MASDLAEKAREAFVDDDFQLAVDLYTQAITLNPASADLFADRAQANIKLNNFTGAVGDANKAIELDRSMAKAYLRKGIACLKLEEYHTAEAALEIGASLAQNDSRFTRLLNECDQHIEEENRLLNKSFTPNGQASTIPASVEILDFAKQCNLSNQIDTNLKTKYRHEFYQKPDEVVVTIFAKGIPATNVVFEFGEQILSVKIEIPGEDAYHFQPRLYGKVIPDKCRYQVLSTKIEIHLAKAEAINWASLEYSGEAVVPQRVNVSSGGSLKPIHPSSKPRSRDWDKLEAQMKKEEKEEKLDGDAALNKFFREIYQQADEDMRRAMAKSFAFVVEKYKRPLPKLRNTKPDSSRYEERPTPAGTLNVAQLRHIALLHEGKADDHEGPMDAHQIAEKFRVDVAEVQRILQFVSLPPENKKKDQNNF